MLSYGCLQLESGNPFLLGDSADSSYTAKMTEFLGKLSEIIEGKRLDVTFILDDPAGNSYLQVCCVIKF